VSNPKLKDLKIGRTGLKPTLGEPSNKFKIPKLRPKVNLLKRKELHNTGLKQTRVKIRNEEPHNTWYKPTRVQIRNEEPHDTGISLKPTRVQIRNEEHHNTGSINQQELFQKEICSMEFSHSSDSNTCKWEIPQKEVGPNGNYHMALDGMGFQACPE
jgi:hypothetical protein